MTLYTIFQGVARGTVPIALDAVPWNTNARRERRVQRLSGAVRPAPGNSAWGTPRAAPESAGTLQLPRAEV